MVEPEDRTGDSDRTRYRVNRKLAHETADKFRDLFYEELDINLPEKAVFSKEELYYFFLHIALKDDFANNLTHGVGSERSRRDSRPDTLSGLMSRVIPCSDSNPWTLFA